MQGLKKEENEAAATEAFQMQEGRKERNASEVMVRALKHSMTNRPLDRTKTTPMEKTNDLDQISESRMSESSQPGKKGKGKVKRSQTKKNKKKRGSSSSSSARIKISRVEEEGDSERDGPEVDGDDSEEDSEPDDSEENDVFIDTKAGDDDKIIREQARAAQQAAFREQTKTRLGKIVSKPNLNMSYMSQNENREISKILTHQLVKEVTKTMNSVNFQNFETRVNELILTLLERPVRKIQQNDELITKMAESLRKNIRRTHEIEFIIQKYQRATTCVEKFEHRFNEMSGQFKMHGAIYDDQFREINKHINELIPQTLTEIQREMNSWKRLMDRTERELNQLADRQSNDTMSIMSQQKDNFQHTEKRINEMVLKQATFETQKAVMDTQIQDMMEQIAQIQTECTINKNTIGRVSDEFAHQTALLTKTVKKVEHDRMSKYYKQVGELNDWKLKVQEHIDNAAKVTEAVSMHFTVEHQVASLNRITDVMLKVLDGHQYNRLIDVINEKQQYLARKKLGMNKNQLKDRLMLACRALKEKQPLPQMPEKIPQDKLPPADMTEFFSKLTSMEKKKTLKKRSNHSRSSHSVAPKEKTEASKGGHHTRVKSKQKTKNKQLHESSVSQMSAASPAQKRVQKIISSNHQASHQHSHDKLVKESLEVKVQKTEPSRIALRGAAPHQDLKINIEKVEDPTSPHSAYSKTPQPIMKPVDRKDQNRLESIKEAADDGTIALPTEQEKIELKSQLKGQVGRNQTQPLNDVMIVDQNYKSGETVAAPVQPIESGETPVKVAKADTDLQKQVAAMLPFKSKIATQVQQSNDSSVLKRYSRCSQPRSIVNQQLSSDSFESDNEGTREAPPEEESAEEEADETIEREIELEVISLQNSEEEEVVRKAASVKNEDYKDGPAAEKQGSIRSGLLLLKPQETSSASKLVTSYRESATESVTSQSSSSVSEGEIRRIMEEMREKWQQEDDNMYASKIELDATQESLMNTNTRIDEVHTQLSDFERFSAEVRNANEAQFKVIDDKLKETEQRAVDSIVKLDQARVDMARDMQEQNQYFNRKLDKQFDDFILKIDGELTRRNRLRVEVFNKFDQQEALILKAQKIVEKFGRDQSNLIGTISKLVYMQDIQTALNIQDELDREWVALFGKIEERTGFKQASCDPKKAINHGAIDNSRVCKYTMHPDCMSCTDNMATNLNLFKIACINYQSNPVYYQGQSIHRQELLSLQKVITNMAKDAIESRFDNMYEEFGGQHHEVVHHHQFTVSQEDPEITPQEHHHLRHSSQQDQNASHQPRLSPSFLSQLTIRAKSKALELMKDLDFKDRDLRKLSVLQIKQQQVKEKYFSNSVNFNATGSSSGAGSINVHASLRALHRKNNFNNRNHNGAQSALTNYLNSSMMMPQQNETTQPSYGGAYVRESPYKYLNRLDIDQQSAVDSLRHNSHTAFDLNTKTAKPVSIPQVVLQQQQQLKQPNVCKTPVAGAEKNSSTQKSHAMTTSGAFSKQHEVEAQIERVPGINHEASKIRQFRTNRSSNTRNILLAETTEFASGGFTGLTSNAGNDHRSKRLDSKDSQSNFGASRADKTQKVPSAQTPISGSQRPHSRQFNQKKGKTMSFIDPQSHQLNQPKQSEEKSRHKVPRGAEPTLMPLQNAQFTVANKVSHVIMQDDECNTKLNTQMKQSEEVSQSQDSAMSKVEIRSKF